MIIMIAAITENNTLGKDNSLLWHLPNDFKRFKLLTSGHYIIMGRKTFESFPKPLPNRVHVIISRQKDYSAKGCIVVDSIEKAIAVAPKNENIFIIGGGEIYNIGLKWADKIELTRIHTQLKGDAYFPEIDPNEWNLVHETFHPKDEKHTFSFSYQTLIRNK